MNQIERPEQLKFPFLNYENDLGLRAFVLTPNRRVRGRRQRALFAFRAFGKQLSRSVDLIDNGKPLLTALAERLKVKPWVIRALRTADPDFIGDQKTLESIASWLSWFPPEKLPAHDEWRAFADAAKTTEELSFLMGIPPKELLERCAFQWRNLASSVDGVSSVDAVNVVLSDFTKGVFLPEIYLQAQDMQIDLPGDLFELKFEDLPQNTRRHIAEALFGRKGPSALIELCKGGRYRAGYPLSTPGGDNARQYLANLPCWGSLIVARKIDANHQVMPLTSAEEMIEEGLALSHCLGRYALRAAFDWYLPISIRTVGGYRLSSALLRLNNNNDIQVFDHRGYRNHAPDPRATALLAVVVRELNDDQALKSRWKSGCAARCQASGMDVPEAWYTYQFYFKPARDWVFSAYWSPLLPAAETHLTRDRWLSDKKIVDLAKSFAAYAGAEHTWRRMVRDVRD